MRQRLVFVAVLFCFASHREPPAAAEPAAQKTDPAKTAAAEIAIGRELFLREWLPNDPRSHGGDGLGPVFNDTSCVACHNLGGTGGGGPASKNVDIVTVAPAKDEEAIKAHKKGKGAKSGGDSNFITTAASAINVFRLLFGVPVLPVEPEPNFELKIKTDALAKFHPRFQTARSIVLPRFGTEPDFANWHPVNSLFDRAMHQELTPAPRPKDLSAAQEVVRDKGKTKVNWNIRQRFTNAVQPVFTFFKNQLIVDLGLGIPSTEFGVAKEAQITRGVAVIMQSGAGSRRVLSAMALAGSDHSGKTFVEANAFPVFSQRNPTALFGAGLIDSIPDSVIEESATSKHRDSPFVTGRVSRLRDGRIGKFGWKGQTASLRDFTLTACAVELGLNVPGHEQAVVPYKPEYRSPGFDLNEQECDALVAYLASLPAPSRAESPNAKYASYLDDGEKLFAETGCAACHTRKLGDVDGIYSDLLLHDMGPALADSGIYGTILPEDPDENESEPVPELVAADAVNNAAQLVAADGIRSAKQKSRSPRRAEWRTPPLWGVRDSGPYLHDGSAETLQDAIAMHGGEALPSTNKFFKLSHEKRRQLIGFLKSLTAPDSSAGR